MLTIGSDCKIPDLKRDEVDGAARSDLINVAPLLCPASVIFEEQPPKEGITRCRKFRAVTTSLTPRLVWPLGARKPS